MTPLVSICLPSLNTRAFLPERLETILAQTVADWELIVCDSYSDDGSWEFFQKFKQDARIQLHQVPRAGIYAGWNECLRRARGHYVYVATSDDTCAATLLEKLIGTIAPHPDVSLVSCNVALIDEQSQPYRDPDFPYGKQLYGDWLHRPHRRHGPSEFVATCACATFWNTITGLLFRRSLLSRTGLFPEHKSSLADYQWGLRACLSTDAVHLPEPLATWRVRTQQATRSLDWARLGWSYVGMIQETLAASRDQLPAGLWDPQLQRDLTWPKQLEAFHRLQLSPRLALRHPARFVRHLGYGLARQPGLTLAHLLRGGRSRSLPVLNLTEWVQSMLARSRLPPICSAIR